MYFKQLITHGAVGIQTPSLWPSTIEYTSAAIHFREAAQVIAYTSVHPVPLRTISPQSGLL
jgi:hypothetical protein